MKAWVQRRVLRRGREANETASRGGGWRLSGGYRAARPPPPAGGETAGVACAYVPEEVTKKKHSIEVLFFKVLGSQLEYAVRIAAGCSCVCGRKWQ